MGKIDVWLHVPVESWLADLRGEPGGVAANQSGAVDEVAGQHTARTARELRAPQRNVQFRGVTQPWNISHELVKQAIWLAKN